MKKITLFLLAGSLVLTFSTIAMAQPPGPPPPVPNQRFARSAEETLDFFLYICNDGMLSQAADFVEGANPGDPALELLRANSAISMGHFQFYARNFTTTPDLQNPDLATATYNLGIRDSIMGYGLLQKDSVQMRKHLLPNGKEYWMIVPVDIKTTPLPMPAGFLAGEQVNDKSGYTEYLATMVAYPHDFLLKAYLGHSKEQLQQLALAMMQFLQDNNERYDSDQQNFKEKLTPYLKDASVFTAPGDPPGTASYDVNPNILGLSMAAFNSPSSIVAFYLGHDQKLDFRFGGLTPVCFMDGHVKDVTPEEAKSLQWKP